MTARVSFSFLSLSRASYNFLVSVTPGSLSLVLSLSFAFMVSVDLLIGLSVYLTGILSQESSLRSSFG